MNTNKKGRQPGTFEDRDYYRKYRSNLHDLLDQSATMYKLSRVLTSKTILDATNNAKNQGCMPVKKTFTALAKALYYIMYQSKKDTSMNYEEFEMWLADASDK